MITIRAMPGQVPRQQAFALLAEYQDRLAAQDTHGVLVRALHTIDPKYPAADPAEREQVMQPRAELVAELGIGRPAPSRLAKRRPTDVRHCRHLVAQPAELAGWGMPRAPYLASVPGIYSGPTLQGRSLKRSGVPDGNRRREAATADPQYHPGAARPGPLDAFPYPPGCRARRRLGPRRAVHHDRQLPDEQTDPAQHAGPEHGAGRLDWHPLPRRRGDRGAGVRADVRHARAPQAVHVDPRGLPVRHRPDGSYPEGVRLDRLPLRDPDHRRHGHRRRVLGHQLGDR